MNRNVWGCWTVALVLGCSSRLQVDHGWPTSGGSGGAQAGNGANGGSDTGVMAGAGGTITEPIPPGSYGQPCIPSFTRTEAMGTFGQADVLALAHCAVGLTCSADDLCVPIPDCPQTSGICAVYRSDSSATAGGGAGGASGGAGGVSSGGGHSFGGDGAALALPETGVQALVADDSSVYWVEYGTRDALGNYANDGSLKVYDGAATKTLSSSLTGPVDLALTSRHAYVYVDGAPLLGSSLTPQLLRVPLSGGKAELIQDGITPQSFVGAGNRAFWGRVSVTNGGVTGAIYSATADVDAVPSVFVPNVIVPRNFAADETSLYYNDLGGSPQIQSAPIAGGPPVSTGVIFSQFVLRGDSIYALDGDGAGGLVLAQAPKAGGPVKHVRPLGDGGGDLRLVGDRYFWVRSGADSSRFEIMTASFASSEPVTRLLEATSLPDKAVWAVTATALYWFDGSAIYSRSLADLQ